VALFSGSPGGWYRGGSVISEAEEEADDQGSGIEYITYV